jgi:hypothetical protein
MLSAYLLTYPHLQSGGIVHQGSSNKYMEYGMGWDGRERKVGHVPAPVHAHPTTIKDEKEYY